ncbi:MAG: Glu-tRNA(Gln) amidotransferase subunit GatD [Candidatus Kariarchaeaceae archaeon]|jgi:glutamyl-tRNA(Gln) amidotransferase subunit D
MAKKRSKTVTVDSVYGNYDPAITQRFEQASIVPGDRITLISGEKEVEGNLLAQNELGNPSTIIIKLDNGYNVGVTVDKNFEVTKQDGSVELESFEIRVPDQESNLPQISLIATGGTIASRIDYKTGGVVMAMEPEEIFATLPELFNEVSFKEVKSLFTLGSEDLSASEWKIMAREAASQIDEGTNGVVFTHGTDTMGYSSAVLSFMLQDLPVPVVLTGAQRSSDRGSYDGALNLIAAARAAAHANIAEVMVCMHHSSEDEIMQLSRGTKVRKMHTSRRDAFKTINEEPLALIDRDGKITQKVVSFQGRNDRQVKLLEEYEEKVGLIKTYPGVPPALLDWHVDQGYRGIILEGTGLGHVPTFPLRTENSWIPSIERAAEEGVFIGMTSQCLNGRVHPYVYRALRTALQAGVTYLGDMLPETALMKTGWTLGNFEDDYATIMTKNIAGEFSTLLKYTEY